MATQRTRTDSAESAGSAESGSRTREDGVSMTRAVERAATQFAELVGRQPHSVTGARKLDEGGWSVLIDVIELERIPWSTSVMATYRVDTDQGGELVGYERLRRFTLGATDPS